MLKGTEVFEKGGLGFASVPFDEPLLLSNWYIKRKSKVALLDQKGEVQAAL